MPFTATGYNALALAQWLEGIRAAIRTAIPGAQVEDQRYVLARVLLVLSEELQRADNGIAHAIAMLDPSQAEGYWLRLIAWRLQIPQLAGRRSSGTGQVTATPGTVFSGSEEAEDASTGLRWQVGPGTVGVTGIANLPMRAKMDGPNLASTDQDDWTIKTELPAWTVFAAVDITDPGRLAETEDALRERVEAAAGERPATEYGDETQFARLGSDPTQSSLLGFKVNRNDVPDENGIPPHYLEAVFSGDVTAAQVWQAMRETPSSTAGTWGNRSVTQQGPYGPLTYRYSLEESLRLYANVVADTVGAPGAVPVDLAAQLSAGLEAWALTLGAGNPPTAADAETYLRTLLPTPTPVVDLEVTFSLDNVTFASVIPVTIRQRPRISNQPSAAEIIGTVPGPYVFFGGEGYTLGFDGAVPVGFAFGGSETTVDDVIALFNSGGSGGIFDRTSDDATATLIIRSPTVGSSSVIEVGFSTPEPPVVLGIPGAGTFVFGFDTDITVNILT